VTSGNTVGGSGAGRSSDGLARDAPATARQLIALGFSIEAFERLGHADLETFLLTFIELKMAGLTC